jgi:hypothetical protein
MGKRFGRMIDGALVLAAVGLPVAIWRAAGVLQPWRKTVHSTPANDPTTTVRLAEVLNVARSMKLVTTVVDSTVVSKAVDERWRGTASAEISAPVKYHFGVDLAKIDADAAGWDVTGQRFTLKIPKPELVATEVDAAHPVSEKVEATGLRMKSMSGEKQLNRATKALHEQAKLQELPADVRGQIETQAAEQVQKAFDAAVGRNRVSVRFQ